ncbi:MAG: Calx-beta domain-containing protein, partial [Pseudomonadota bacterium]
MPTVTFEPFPFLSSGATATVGDFILTAVQTPQSGAVSSFSQFPVGGSPGDLSFGGQQNWTFTITHKDGAIFDVDSARVVTVEGGVIADTLVFATPDGESETLSFISGAPGGMQSPPLSLGTDFEGISSVSITGNSAGGAQRVFVDDIVISNVSQPGPIPTRPIDDVARTQETAGTEPFSLVLSNLGDGPVIGTQAVVETVATLTASSTAIAEAGGMSTLTITLDRPAPAGGVSIPLTVGGTASHNLDFSLSTAQVAFTAGSTSQTVTVYALPDTTDDDAESVTIGLGPPSNSDVILGTPSQQTISIIDDDQAPAINLASVSVHEADGAATLAVTLDRPSSQPVSVTVGTTNTGTATAGVDFAPISQTVVFAPGDIRETVTIIIGDNSVVEDVETVIVSLSAPTNATIGAAGSGTVTITDSDSAFLSIGDAQITEADGELSLDFEIRLSSAVDTGVSVTAATRDGSAGAGSDYTAVTTTARIAAGSLSTTVSVPILGDNLDEAAESFELVLSNLDAGGRAVSLPYAVGLGTIFDDDAAPVATDDDLAMDEGTDLAGDVRANDSDADDGRDALTITLTDDVDNGRLTLNTDGTFAYTPDAGFTGVDSFTYSASDGTNTASATAMITVRRVLDAPVAVADTTTIIGPDSAELDVLANDVDGQGDGLTITALDLSLTTGLAEILSSAGAADRILYTPTVLPGTPDTPLI